ncbi:hypothetical protein SAMN04489864_104155 [Pedobacter insulae]|uniref:Uncharacterized protein n=1 Tax=Pedobacter insulae TaxID=414048 RepID=A0A1I2WM48_9SPHI|nr:hypothetical protein SAMN04489864_104155 [Pedobacter insulae]
MLILAYRHFAYKYSIFKSKYTLLFKIQYFERTKANIRNNRPGPILGRK